MEYEKLEKLLQALGERYRLEAHAGYLGENEKGEKRQLHLYGAREVSIRGRKPQKTYVAGIIQHKAFISFYFMPMYSHPDAFTQHLAFNTQSTTIPLRSAQGSGRVLPQGLTPCGQGAGFTLSPAMQKAKKGKSCLHIKEAGEETLRELAELFDVGIELYRKDGLI